MTTLKVSVTQPLIERATQRDSRHCMIAEAILAARPDFRNVMVDLATIRWSNPRTNKRYVALTPEVAAAALVRFDQGETVEPFDLNLDPIQTTARSTKTKQLTIDDELAGGGKSKGRGKRPSRKRELSVNEHNGKPTIEGGRPLAAGHLSNVARSGRRFREYGLRQLAQ